MGFHPVIHISVITCEQMQDLSLKTNFYISLKLKEDPNQFKPNLCQLLPTSPSDQKMKNLPLN